ncbi:Receptor-like kinase [Quillaja saponaria]|uniref:Receptor-like kinase n=1 Tax=Quillaja saponaria TaxID=32244 RepID=A0AAD7PDA0_QUISA|nr:Receptor-like kinase [Quillaja saponaria]
MDSTNLVVFTSHDLRACTNNFNEKNLISLTQFGRLYRGQIQKPRLTGIQTQYVSVKIWDPKLDCIASKYDDEYFMIKEEVKFFTNPRMNGNPNLVKLIACCWEREIQGLVYDLNPLDTLHNLIVKDELNWLQRMNVIHELARLLEFLHCQENQPLVLNISASHILLDTDYMPKLFDSFQPSEMKMQKELMPMSTGYLDPYFSLRGSEWDRSCEVFSFGVILLELITKRISILNIEKRENNPNSVLDGLLHIWAKKEYKPSCCLVHSSLQENWDYYAEDGVAVTELAMQCIEFFPVNRPSMNQILQCLENLLVCNRLADKRPAKRGKKFLL